MDKNTVQYLRFNEKIFEQAEFENLEQVITDESCINWINIKSLSYIREIDDLISKFGISPLVIEDIKNSNQIPKTIDYGDYVFMIVEGVEYDGGLRLHTKQLSIVLFKNLIITIQEKESAVFNEISTMIEERISVRNSGTDNLFYIIIDYIVDNYFDVLEEIGEKIDNVEDQLLYNPEREVLEETYRLKRDLINIRKTLWLMRNAIGSINQNEFELVGSRALNYFRDEYNHIVQLIDLTETYRDICSGMLEIYLSSISNKTNDIMKVLTIFSTIFIPLTFLVGIYGMNFINMPEVNWKYGYMGFWIVSLIITGIMIRFFRGKKWL